VFHQLSTFVYLSYIFCCQMLTRQYMINETMARMIIRKMWNQFVLSWICLIICIDINGIFLLQYFLEEIRKFPRFSRKKLKTTVDDLWPIGWLNSSDNSGSFKYRRNSFCCWGYPCRKMKMSEWRRTAHWWATSPPPTSNFNFVRMHTVTNSCAHLAYPPC
jgi:hypothetical protein